MGLGESKHLGKYVPVKTPKAVPKDARIGIIGTGPSGLLANRWLKRHGFTNVVSFEKENLVGGHATTIEVDGYHFDLSTKFIPTTNVKCLGPHPDFQKMLDEYKDQIKLMETPAPVVYNVKKKCIDEVPHCLKKFDKLKIIKDMIYGFTATADFAEYPIIINSLRADPPLTFHGESLEEWGKRNKLEAYTALAAYLADTFGSGPSAPQAASFAMSYREHYITTYLVKIIRGALDKASFGQKVVLQSLIGMYGHPQLKKFLEMDKIPPFHVFKDGYQSFWQAVLNDPKDKLDVRLETPVKLAKYSEETKEWLVTTEAGDEHRFDVLICSTSPKAYKYYLPDEPISKLMDMAQQGPGPEMWVFRVKEWNMDVYQKERGIWLFYDRTKDFGTANVQMDSRLYGFSKEYADSNVLVGIAYPDEKMPYEEKEKQLREDCAEAGLDVTKIEMMRRFKWPAHIPAEIEAKHEWHETVENMQGDRGLFCIGEALFAAGIMSTVDGTEDFFKRFFHD